MLQVAVFAVIIYLQGFNINIPVKSKLSNCFCRQCGLYIIKLLYTMNMPIMLAAGVSAPLPCLHCQLDALLLFP